MSDDFSSFLTPDERRNYIFNEIPYSDWSSQSGAAILDKLKRGGLGINESDFYDIRRLILSDISNTDKIAQLPDNYQIPAAFHNEGRFWYMQGDFAYNVGFRVFDPTTKQSVDRWVTIQSDNRLSAEDAIAQAAELIESQTDNYGYSIEDQLGLRASHRPGLYS